MKIPNMFLHFKLDKNEGTSLDFSFLFKHFDWTVQDKLTVQEQTVYFIQKKKIFQNFQKNRTLELCKRPHGHF